MDLNSRFEIVLLERIIFDNLSRLFKIEDNLFCHKYSHITSPIWEVNIDLLPGTKLFSPTAV
ncbi:hypothetical protein SPPR111872_12300 [Sphingobacterium prati]